MLRKSILSAFLLFLLPAVRAEPVLTTFILQEAGHINRLDTFEVDYRIIFPPASVVSYPIRSFSLRANWDASKLQMIDVQGGALDPSPQGGTPFQVSGFPEITGSGTFSRGTQGEYYELDAFQKAAPQLTLIKWKFIALTDGGTIPFGLAADFTSTLGDDISYRVTSNSVYIPRIPSEVPTPVPEPAALALFGLGIGALCLRRGKKSLGSREE